MERSPLDAVHREAGARMVPFGGWEMPLEYPSGTIAEHQACRTGAVVFDVSHLGTVRVDGDGCARARLQTALTNDLGKIGPGRAQYTHLLDEADASVLDDIIVWWHPDQGAGDVFDVMPNASNTDRVRDAVGGTETTATRAVLAVQGPEARDRLRDGVPRCGCDRPFPGGDGALGRRRVRGRGHRLHRRAGARDRRARRSRGGPVGRDRGRGDRPGRTGRAATRCGSKRACRSTATSSGLGSHRSKPVSAGWWRGTSPSSVARPR